MSYEMTTHITLRANVQEPFCIILIYNLSVAFWYDGLTLDQEVISPNLYDLNAVPRGKK